MNNFHLFVIMIGKQTDMSTPALPRTVNARTSPESARSLLGNQSSIGSTCEAEYRNENKNKNELNLYDWLSATNSPRQKSNSSEQNIPASSAMPSDIDQTKSCTSC